MIYRSMRDEDSSVGSECPAAAHQPLSSPARSSAVLDLIASLLQMGLLLEQDLPQIPVLVSKNVMTGGMGDEMML